MTLSDTSSILFQGPIGLQGLVPIYSPPPEEAKTEQQRKLHDTLMNGAVTSDLPATSGQKENRSRNRSGRLFTNSMYAPSGANNHPSWNRQPRRPLSRTPRLWPIGPVSLDGGVGYNGGRHQGARVPDANVDFGADLVARKPLQPL